jgi:hypothetical protein
MQVVNLDNFLAHPEVLSWLQTLEDCPPGVLRHGYGLLSMYWRVYKCNHACCAAADGCVVHYYDACNTVDRAIIEMVDAGIIVPVGVGVPVQGHTHDAGCPEAYWIKGGQKWDYRTDPAYIWGFESGDNLGSILG